MTRPWRLGSHSSEKPGPLVSVWEIGEGEPDDEGRRVDDRLVGSLPRLEAEAIVAFVNERSWIAADVTDVIDAAAWTVVDHVEQIRAREAWEDGL